MIRSYLTNVVGCVVCVTVMVLACGIAAAGDSPNLLLNPGFEAPSVRQKDGADPWRMSSRRCTRAEWCTEARSGRRCLHLSGESGREEASACSARTAIKGGQWYELSAWIKTRDVQAGTAFVKVDVYADTARLTTGWRLQTGATHGWRRLSARIQAPAGATHLFVYPYLYRSAGDVWFDDLSLVEALPMERAPMTDEAFFQAVDLDRPDMALAKRSVEAGDYASARRAFLEALRVFKPPKYLFDPTARRKPDPKKPCPAADKICRHELTFYGTTYKYPDHVYFDKLPPIDDKHFIFYLNWTSHWATLVQAWWDTGREEYITEWNREVLEWTRSFPEAGEPGYPFMDWSGGRVSRWTTLWYRAREATGFTEEARMAFLKSLVQQTRHVLTRVAPHPQLQPEMALFTAGLMFPQFKESKEWLAGGIRRMDDILAKEVYPDGAECELTTHYQQLPIIGCGQVIRLSKANGIELPKRLVETFDRLHEYYMWVVKPNGQTPQINDADIDRVRRYLKKRGQEINRADFLFVGTGGREGKPPAECSHALPFAGQYVMRTSWREDATYLIFDAGPYGTGHQHHDALNVDLWAGGRSLLVDPGRYTYLKDPWRRFFVGGWSHNGIVVDGQVQNRANEPGHIAYPLDNRWISLPGHDVAVGAYDGGFGARQERLAHWTRWVLFRKPDLFVVLDILRGKGEHSLQQMWHFAPMAVDRSANGTLVTANKSGGNLLLAPPDTSGLKPELVEGREDPVQGWFSPRFRVKQPAPTAFYSTQSRLPFVFKTVLLPFCGTDRPAVAVRELGAPSRPSTIALEVIRNGERDVLVLGQDPPFGEKSVGDVVVDGELAWASFTSDGKPRSLLCVNARRVEVRGKTLFRSAVRTPKTETQWRGDVVEVEGGLPVGAELFAADATRVTWAGKPVDTERAGDRFRVAGPPATAPVITDVRTAPVGAPRDPDDPYSSLDVTFRTSSPARGYILYGRRGIEFATQQETSPHLEHTITLRNLRAGGKYVVRAAAVAGGLALGEPVDVQAP